MTCEPYQLDGLNKALLLLFMMAFLGVGILLGLAIGKVNRHA